MGTTTRPRYTYNGDGFATLAEAEAARAADDPSHWPTTPQPSIFETAAHYSYTSTELHDGGASVVVWYAGEPVDSQIFDAGEVDAGADEAWAQWVIDVETGELDWSEGASA